MPSVAGAHVCFPVRPLVILSMYFDGFPFSDAVVCRCDATHKLRRLRIWDSLGGRGQFSWYMI